MCVFGALLVATAACGTSPGSGSAATSPPAAATGSALGLGTATSNGTEPSAEPTGLESAGPSGSKVSVSTATLPIGGGPNTFLEEPACVTVNYKGALSGGMTVAVTAVEFSPSGVFVHSGGCGGDPDCAPPFAFTSDGPPCSVNLHAVAKKMATTTMNLKGTPYCTAAAKSSCTNLSAGPGITLTWSPSSSAPPSSPQSSSPRPYSSPPSSSPKSVAPQGPSS